MSQRRACRVEGLCAAGRMEEPGRSPSHNMRCSKSQAPSPPICHRQTTVASVSAPGGRPWAPARCAAGLQHCYSEANTGSGCRRLSCACTMLMPLPMTRMSVLSLPMS